MQGAIGACVTKVSEAEVLIKAGFGNILITSPIVTHNKISRLLAILAKDPDLTVVIDNPDNAKAINAAAQTQNLTANVLVDIDPGVHRTGISPENAVEFGMFLHSLPNLNLRGIQCYAGNLQHIHNYEERKQATLLAMKQAATIADDFIMAGIPCDVVSGGGTGTYDIDCDIKNMTEIQPGSYVVMDAEYHNIASANGPKFTLFKPAMTLLTTVISNNHDTHVTVDAGLKSLYFDPNTKPIILSHPQLRYEWAGFGDEHGKVIPVAGANLPTSGEVIEMVVPHCDPTINLFDKFFITEKDKVIDVWTIDLRGRSQ